MSFLWASTEVITRKSPVSWKKVCAPRNKCGLNIIDFQGWNKASMLKNQWNLNNKVDSLWIRWIYIDYSKGVDIMNVRVKQSASWIIYIGS